MSTRESGELARQSAPTLADREPEELGVGPLATGRSGPSDQSDGHVALRGSR